MKAFQFSGRFCFLILSFLFLGGTNAIAQQVQSTQTEKVESASRKIKSGYKKGDNDTLAQGFFDLGETYYQSGELSKSEDYYKKAKKLYEKRKDAEGIAKSSRALARVQEDLNKDKEALTNYTTARDNSFLVGDVMANTLNENDVRRLSGSDSLPVLESLIQRNIKLGLVNKDTGEIVNSFSRWGDVNLANKNPTAAVNAYKDAYNFSVNQPNRAAHFNKLITDVYLKNDDFDSAIITKKALLNEKFVLASSQLQAQEITSLADIYLLKKEDTTAIRLLNESYALSIRNGHTLEAKSSVEKLDSIFRLRNKKEQSLKLYKDFLQQLPSVIARDSSIADNKLIAETESRIKELETEKAEKDSLIRRKNVSNRWLMVSVIVLIGFAFAILYVVRKLHIRNKKIALQSLRREMNPHFIFNSLNSINQFIASNNELEANRYLTKFSTLMRRVMENSKDDFVPLTREVELLEAYLELEQSRFPDKFSFEIHTDDELIATEHYSMPGMLIQPHLENAIWHGLRYSDKKGKLNLSFNKKNGGLEVIIEDNGIGIAESKKNKTVNQQKHKGRGLANTQERIRILNELYKKQITCTVIDKTAPKNGVKVIMNLPLVKNTNA